MPYYPEPRPDSPPAPRRKSVPTPNSTHIPERTLRGAIVLLMAGLAAGCAPSIAPYSPVAFEKAVDMKVDALRLMEQAEEPAADHERKITALRRDLDRAWEFAKGRPRNEHSSRQWELMRDPDGHLLGGFLSRWEEEGALGPVFISESQRLISLAFDAIIGLESGKLKPSDV